MAKRVFFSFHYKDVADFRVNVVRNHWVTKEDRDDAGYFDASLWEEAEKKGPSNLKRLINGGLNGTSVTTVLIGSETYARPWVRYEIFASLARGNDLFGVHINGIPDKNRITKTSGRNPFEFLAVKFSADGTRANPWEWDGSKWIEFVEAEGWNLSRARPQNDWGRTVQISEYYTTHDWQSDNGYENFATWVGV